MGACGAGEGMGWFGLYLQVKGGHRRMLWTCMGLMSTPNPKALLPFLDTKQEERHMCHWAELAGKGRRAPA